MHRIVPDPNYAEGELLKRLPLFISLIAEDYGQIMCVAGNYVMADTYGFVAVG